jgi:hypothetical protein
MTERTLSYSPIIFVILIAYIKTKSYFVERGIFLAELDIHWPDIKNYLPGHFFNSEHSPYLFLMFNFKKHRSMHCELLCNQLIPNTRDFEIMLTIVRIDGIGLSCVAWEMSRTFLML